MEMIRQNTYKTDNRMPQADSPHEISFATILVYVVMISYLLGINRMVWENLFTNK